MKRTFLITVALILILFLNTACSNNKSINEEINTNQETKKVFEEIKQGTAELKKEVDKSATVAEVTETKENNEVLLEEFKELTKSVENYNKVLELLDKALPIVDEDVCQEMIDGFIEYRRNYVYSELNKFDELNIYEKINTLYSNDILSFIKFHDINKIADSSIKDYVSKVRELYITYTNVEGEISYEDDFTWYYRYKDYLSQQLKDYLQTHVVEASKNVAGDGAVLISWNEIYDRHRMYEEFLERYPDSKYKEEIVRQCDWYLHMYFRGLDNTPAFGHDSKIDEELRASYLEKAKYGEDSMANKILALYIPILDKNSYMKTEEVRDFLDEVFTKNDTQEYFLEGSRFKGGYGFFREGKFYPISEVKKMEKAETDRLNISKDQIGDMIDLCENTDKNKRFAFNMTQDDTLEISIIDMTTDKIEHSNIFSIDSPFFREKVKRYDSGVYLKIIRDNKNEIIKIDEAGKEKKIYSGKYFSYSVSPDESYVAIYEDERILILDQDGEMIYEYKDIFELKEINEGLDILGWSDDSTSLWIEKAYVNDRESIYKLDVKNSKYYQYNVSHLGLNYYDLNTNTGKIVYDDYPMYFFDISDVYEFEKSGEKVSLYIYDLETEKKIKVCENIAKSFMPRWKDNNTLEYYSSDEYSRVLYKIEDTEDIFEAMRNAKLGNLRIGMKVNEVIKELGECKDKGEPTVWGADGLEHQDWDYKDQGINLDMVREEDDQVVFSIYVVSPYKEVTDKSIGIGSNREHVLKAYEKDINSEETNDSSIVVGTIYGGLIFRIEDGVVSSIFIGAAAE